MPNWCENDLEVTGEKVDLDEFKKFFKYDKDTETLDFKFTKIIEYPKEFRDLDIKAKKHNAKQKTYETHIKDGFNSGVYEWCVENWDTKWDLFEKVSVDDYGYNYTNFSFDTAWSPPHKIIKALGKMFPKLIFTMRSFEGGCQSNWLLSVEQGEVVSDLSGDYYGTRGG